MKISGYDLVKVTEDSGRIHVRGAADKGNAFLLLDIEYRHLGFDVLHRIWRAVWAAEHVAVVGYADVRHEVARDLAERSGQLEAAEETDAEAAEAAAAAFDATLNDIAAMRRHMAAELETGAEVAA